MKEMPVDTEVMRGVKEKLLPGKAIPADTDVDDATHKHSQQHYNSHKISCIIEQQKQQTYFIDLVLAKVNHDGLLLLLSTFIYRKIAQSS